MYSSRSTLLERVSPFMLVKLTASDTKDGLNALGRFTSGRWLWSEQQQLHCRYVKFGLPELLNIASSVVGARSCARASRAFEGQYNKVLLLNMNSRREIIAKLPNPTADRPYFTTSSKVTTIDL